MIRRAGSARVQSRFEKQIRENMDLKMHLKSRKMAEKKCRKAGMGAKQGRAFRAQRLWTCVPAAAIRAIKPGQFSSCKEKRMSSLQPLIRDKRGGCRCCLSLCISNEGVGTEGAGSRRRGRTSTQRAPRGRMP